MRMRKPEQRRIRGRHVGGLWPLPAVLLVAALVPGCFGSDNENSPSESGTSADPPVAAPGPGGGAPKRIVDRCDWTSARQAPESAVRKTFVDREAGGVRLLLADDTIRPGEILRVAVANDSSESVEYGTFSHVESEDGERVRIKGPYGFPDIGLHAPA